MSTQWTDAVAALGPLRVRAHQLQHQIMKEQEAALRRWEQSEKPVLKELAAGMKDTLQVLTREEASLKKHVAGLTTASIRNHPGTSTGFNVIRARVDAYGQPLPTNALVIEKERLLKAIDKLEVEIAGAKAEITQHRRSEEAEIWETKLVALQDTKRVYRDEINLIEVELLGREHYERMERDRQMAEDTGTARLQRVQEQMLQSRMKLNKAKRGYYFPDLKGFNITFGGGGIYGACKDICISEINGCLDLVAEPGGINAEGVYNPARMTVTFKAPGGVDGPSTKQQQQGITPTGQHHQQQGSTYPSSSSSPPKSRQTSTSTSTTTVGNKNDRPLSAPLFQGQPSVNGHGSPARHASMHYPQSDQLEKEESIVKRSISFPAATKNTTSHPTPVAANNTSGGNGGGSSTDLQQEQSQPTSNLSDASSVDTNSANAAAVHPQKGKGFASRFLRRLGNRKAKFQGKEVPLQPARDEDDMVDAVGQKRSLASKLLSRRPSSLFKGGNTAAVQGSGSNNGAQLERLAFGGNRLSDPRHRSSIGTYSEDDTTSMRIAEETSSMADNVSDIGDVEYIDERLDPVPEYSMDKKDVNLAGVEEHDEGDGSLASDDDEEGGNGSFALSDGLGDGDTVPSPLTREALQRAESNGNGAYFDEQRTVGGRAPSGRQHGASSARMSSLGARSSNGRGSWLRGAYHDGQSSAGGGGDGMSVLDDAASSILELQDTEDLESGINEMKQGGFVPRGVFCTGRLSGFELVGEKGSKVPNLLIGKADVRATVYVRFVFEYNKTMGWGPGSRPGDKPMFHVEKLKYTIAGNNVPMPPTLIKHILRVAIPGLIQRRLLALLPKEFGEYLLTCNKGFDLTADVGVVGPALAVLDADLGFEVRGPAKSAKEARQQQALYGAAKEARSLLGLSLPQAQVLAELFNGGAALLDPPRPASITNLISFKARYEKHPKVFKQICQVIDTAYQVLAQAQGVADVSDFSFVEFLDGSLAKMRRKPAKSRVIVRKMNLDLNADAIVTAIHDFTQRSIEELIVKGPLIDPGATLESMKEAVAEDFEVLHAWHAFALKELQHFKSKFKGAAGTAIVAADSSGFSGGIENCYYEGPLRLRLPVSIRLDQDGAVSFQLPLPSPQGTLGVFMDNFKALMVPSHVRPPAQAVNWVALTKDTELNERMKQQIQTALGMIREVLADLSNKIKENNMEADDADAVKVLSQPRTSVGDRLGKLIVNRLKVRIRLDEKRIGEILSGIDGASMGGQGAFTATAGRIIGHLGDVLSMGFTPAAAEATPGVSGVGPPAAPDRYLFHVESSDISRLRADVQSLGFQSAITPGGAVRLVHAVWRAIMLSFKSRPVEDCEPFRAIMQGWYRLLTKEQLNVSICLDTKGEVENGAFIASFSGKADEAALRATSPLVMTNEIDLVPLGKAMRGDPPEQPQKL